MRKVKKEYNEHYGVITGFSIWNADGKSPSVCSEGHIWGDKRDINDPIKMKSVMTKSIETFKRRYNWTEDRFKAELEFCFKLNGYSSKGEKKKI